MVRNLTSDCTADAELVALWNAPLQPNGNITSYSVVVTAEDLATGTTVTVQLQDYMRLVPNVTVTTEAYTEYTVKVAAETAAGQGQNSTTSCQTAEGSKLIFILRIILYRHDTMTAMLKMGHLHEIISLVQSAYGYNVSPD